MARHRQELLPKEREERPMGIWSSTREPQTVKQIWNSQVFCMWQGGVKRVLGSLSRSEAESRKGGRVRDGRAREGKQRRFSDVQRNSK